MFQHIFLFRLDPAHIESIMAYAFEVSVIAPPFSIITSLAVTDQRSRLTDMVVGSSCNIANPTEQKQIRSHGSNPE